MSFNREKVPETSFLAIIGQNPDLFNDILSNLSDIVIALDKKGHIVEFNQSAEQFFLIKTHEVKGLTIKDFFQNHGYDLKKLLENIKLPIKSGAREFTQTFAIKSNLKRFVRWRAFPLKTNKKGASLIILIGTDLTSRSIVDSGRGSIRKHLEYVMESLAGGHWWKDIYGRYMSCNDTIARMCGLNSANELIGKTDYEMPWAVNAEQLLHNDREVIEAGQPIRTQERVIDKNGKTLTFLVIKAPLRDEADEIIGTIGSSIDITEQIERVKELQIAKEQAELSDKAKSQFLATISHELRTPLNGIMGAAQLLQQSKLTSDQQRLVEISFSSGMNLIELIDDILNYSKLSDGKLLIENKPFDLDHMIKDSLQNMKFQAELKQLDFTAEFIGKVPVKFVLSDKLRLQEIIINIISNAIKYTSKGFVKVTINYEQSTKNYLMLHVSVEDSGIGIAEDKLEAIFERFIQVESAYNRKFGGVGLGLAITKQLITMMHGSIKVESKLGKGSKFSFSLPLQLGKYIKKREHNNHVEDSSPHSLESNQIDLLLVEDNLVNQTVTRMMLNKTKYKLDIAQDGVSALQKFAEKNYELVFMDISLPDMDGLEVIKRMRSSEKGKYIPIIAMTAHAMEKDKQNFLKAGANDVITKPLMKEKLLNKLEKWLDKTGNVPPP